MKEFKSKKDGSSIHVYERGGQHFIKIKPKGAWLRKVSEHGPFDEMGDALLALCISKDLNFSDYKEVAKGEVNE